MLYVYNYLEYYEEEKELRTIIKNIEELKPLDLGFCYISNTDEIIIEGKNPHIIPLHEFIYDSGYLNNEDVLKIESDLLDSKLEIPKERALELLYDDLKNNGNYQYSDRIWEANNPTEEIFQIIKELTIIIIGMIIDGLNYEYKKIKENGFEWM